MNPNIKRIWWLASYPKSGNTWARMFVNAYITGFPVDLNSAFQYVTGDQQPRMFQLTCACPVLDLEPDAAIYYRSAVLMNHIQTSHSVDTCLKTHHARLEINDYPLIPDHLSKGAVYLVRDPRDVAVSLMNHLDMSADEVIQFMANNEQMLRRDERSLFHWLASWSTHVDSWTTAKGFPVKVIQYEDMLEDPETTFRALLDGLGFRDIKEDRFEFAMKETEFSRLQQKEDETGFRENGRGDRFFKRGEAGTWREVLTEDQVARIESDHQHSMRRFGYEPALVLA